MKKLMIAAAVVCAAALSQAASVTWNTTDYVALPSGGCTTGKDLGKGGDITMFVWEFNATDWAALKISSAADVWSAVQDGTLDLADAKSKASTLMSSKPSISGADTWGDGQDVYAAILYLHDDGKTFTKDSANYYMANYGMTQATLAGGTLGNLGNKIGGSGAATEWQSVPEPTSGLLLLLGVAGLALRRRRA